MCESSVLTEQRENPQASNSESWLCRFREPYRIKAVMIATLLTGGHCFITAEPRCPLRLMVGERRISEDGLTDGQSVTVASLQVEVFRFYFPRCSWLSSPYRTPVDRPEGMSKVAEIAPQCQSGQCKGFPDCFHFLL